MLLALSIAALVALQPPPATVVSRRAILVAAPLATSSAQAAHAFNPLDILFGWIPPVEPDSSSEKAAQGKELTTAEKIRARRKELEQLEAEKQMAEYMKNRGNSAASARTDASGASAAAR